MKRVIICGSRNWSNRAAIEARLYTLAMEHAGQEYPVIVHGNARGVDRIAADEAGKAGFLVESHPAEWEKYGKSAGYKRNELMASLGADLVIAFWDESSAGTKHMMDIAERYNIPVDIVLRRPS